MRKTFMICASVLALLLGACSNESLIAPTPGSDIESIVHGTKSNHLIGIQSAILNIRALETYQNDGAVTVHRITEAWDEYTTTWNTFGSAFDPMVINSFTVEVAGWRSVDVTGLVTDWVAGVHPNHGLLLDQSEDGTPWAKYYSRENSHSRPYLEICFLMSNGDVVCESIEAIADTYVWQERPDVSNGNALYLYTGWKPPSEYEKHSLLAFEIPEIPGEPGEGCTLTPGYWKTHSEFGPAPYDATWALLPDGASTPFFQSDKSYYQVLWTPPRGGNAYYILAHAYIAAELNRLNDADFTDAQAAFDAATGYFSDFTPAQMAALPRQTRQAIIALAETLDDYNNGLIGPGHCDD